MAGDATNAGRWAECDVYEAPVGTTPPVDNDTDPSATWNLIGFLDPDDGLPRGFEEDSDTKSAWGGATIDVINTFNGESFTFTGIEDNDVMFGLVYEGSATPSAVGSLKTRVAKVPVRDNHAWLFQLRNGTKKKTYIVQKGRISAVALKDENNADLGGATITVTSISNSDNELHTEMISGYDDES